jgi:hypothetical protein
MPHKDRADRLAYRKQWWAGLTPERKAEKRIKANERAINIREYLNKVKIERGCRDCGYNAHPAALDFDHVRGEKEVLVSFAKSIARADKEIEKCEVRCANCHRIATWERRRFAKLD